MFEQVWLGYLMVVFLHVSTSLDLYPWCHCYFFLIRVLLCIAKRVSHIGSFQRQNSFGAGGGGDVKDVAYMLYWFVPRSREK
jgi:hypothetical protein